MLEISKKNAYIFGLTVYIACKTKKKKMAKLMNQNRKIDFRESVSNVCV